MQENEDVKANQPVKLTRVAHQADAVQLMLRDETRGIFTARIRLAFDDVFAEFAACIFRTQTPKVLN